MTVKIIRDTDDSFEREKTKMFCEELEKQKPKTKENQLRNAFNRILESHLRDIGTLDDMCSIYVIFGSHIKDITEELLKEVSIRVYIKG